MCQRKCDEYKTAWTKTTQITDYLMKINVLVYECIFWKCLTGIQQEEEEEEKKHGESILLDSLWEWTKLYFMVSEWYLNEY